MTPPWFRYRLQRLQNVFSDWRDRRPRTHFLHVGKTGGSAVKATLVKAETTRYEVEVHDHEFTMEDVPEGEMAFFFVRDPLARFVSGFYSRQREGRPLYDVPWRKGEAEAFARFETADALARALSADNDDHRTAVRAMSAIEHVRSSYWDWFKDEAYLATRMSSILFVGSQERLGSDFAALSALLGADATLPGRDSPAAHANSPKVDRTLSQEGAGNLRQWYADDYEFLHIIRQRFSNIPDYR